MEIIKSYFKELTEEQLRQFEMLDGLYRDWNEKINVISRKDIDNLYLHHVLHSLSIAKFIEFKDGSHILDLGTGGGFPGIPLAIMFPQCKFHLVDSIGKKLKVIDAVCEAIGLTNVRTTHSRVEDLKGARYDFVVTRAVAELAQLFAWCRKHIDPKNINSIPNGLIALKGGNVKKEIKGLPRGEYSEFEKITQYIKEEYFIEKYIVYVQA